MNSVIRSYTGVAEFETFTERFEYLKLDSDVGVATFGFDRYFNQRFYTSREWKSVRQKVIARDLGCDLGVEGHDIFNKILVHHMNPISVDDISKSSRYLLDSEYLICVSHLTHNAIHFGDASLLISEPKERREGDTKLW